MSRFYELIKESVSGFKGGAAGSHSLYKTVNNDYSGVEEHRLTDVFIEGFKKKGQVDIVNQNQLAASVERACFGRQRIGIIVLCGKGVLGAEFKFFDMILRPGVRYAPFEGLGPEEIEMGMFDVGEGEVAAQNKMWDNGARTLLRHAITVWVALLEQQKTLRKYWSDLALDLFDQLMDLEHRSQIMAMRGQDTKVITKQIEDLQIREQCCIEILNAEPYRNSPDGLSRVYQKLLNGIGSSKDQKYSKDLELLFSDLGFEDDLFKIHNFQDRLTNNTVYPDLLSSNSSLRRAIEHYTKTTRELDPKLRSSFTVGLQEKFDALSKGRALKCSAGVPWFMHETGDFKPNEVIFGKTVTIDLNDAIHGDATMMITSLVKQRVYRVIKSRAERPQWRKTECQVSMIIDEVHLVCGLKDAKFFSITRSLGMDITCATQSFESMVSSLGSENNAKLFFTQLSTKIVFEASEPTFQYLMHEIGEAKLQVTKRSINGIDYASAYEDKSMSIFNDVNHPNYEQIRQVRKYAVLKSDNSTLKGFDKNPESIHIEEIIVHNSQKARIEYKTQPILRQDEFNAYAGMAGRPFLHISRAGGVVTDYAIINEIKEKDLLDLHDAKNIAYLNECISAFQ